MSAQATNDSDQRRGSDNRTPPPITKTSAVSTVLCINGFGGALSYGETIMLVKVTAKGHEPKIYDSASTWVNQEDMTDDYAEETGCDPDEIKVATFDFDVTDKAKLLDWVKWA